jgi:Cu(I)/Ag(I) efflux system membrane fusion protein
MKRAYSILVAGGVAAVLVAAGYWWGASRPAPVPLSTGAKADVAGKPRILYYRNPMGLADTSPTPKKDSMGMDYIPVYEGEEPQGPGVKISVDRVQKLGVRTEAAATRVVSRSVRALGTIQVDERAQRTVSPRFEGWIQRLYVNATGEYVRRGQPLMEIYSPDLVAAQQEYLVATRGMAALKDASPEVQANMRSLAEASLQRLRNWDIAEEELAQLRSEGKPRNALTLRAPASGVVLEKPSVQGMRFMPGEVLYRIADLSSVWLLADVFEQDLGLVRVGQAAKVRLNAYPEKVLEGKVAFIYPSVTAETRTAKVRIELRNPGQLLKPAMYASVELSAGGGQEKRLAVPDSAVLDSGTRQIVLVRRGEGLFEPREVKLGTRGDGYVEVLEGVKEGEAVVVSANFLIDAESNLKAAIAGFGQQGQGGAPAPEAAKTHAAEGTVESVDAKTGTVSIAHGPVASLKWPGMTMDFKVKDPALLQGMKAGAKIRFEFAEQGPGEWTVTGLSSVAGAPAAPEAHKGH